MSGAEEALQALEMIKTRGAESVNAALIAMGEVVEREVRAQLGKTSHAPGIRTSSTPGEPPALVSGRLRDSVTVESVDEGHVQVGATTPYARIQELGGNSGKHHATYNPPRPYLSEAWKASEAEAYQAAIQVITEALYSG